MWTQQKTMWAIGGAVAILLIATAIVTVNVIRSNRGSYTRDERATVEQRLVLQIDACRQSQDPEICKRQVVVPQAELLNDAKLCALLDGEAKVGCVESVARVTLDRDDCQTLDGEDQRRCEDTVTMLKATTALDLDGCSDISDEQKRSGCIEQVTARVVDAVACAEHGVEVTLCDERAIFGRAMAEGDVSACDGLGEEDAIKSCKEEVRRANPDPDEGGVVAGDETLDSDGDGYSDDEEIRNGFDPYGPGRL